MNIKKTLLQLNVCSNWGSTGRITEQIGNMAIQNGWESYIAYGRSKRDSQLKSIKVGGKIDVYEHYAEHRFLDNEGLASRRATRLLIQDISKLKPDLIHLHNIHDHWINYEILFSFLSEMGVPVVWTLHDCWSFTGGCSHYTFEKCYKWQSLCSKCSLKHTGILPLIDQTEKHYKKKKELLSSIGNLTLIPVSDWLKSQVEQSFLRTKKIRRIYNGIDISVFKPTVDVTIKERLGLKDKKMLLAVSTAWNEKKGLYDYYKLANIFASDVAIVLVGLDKSQLKELPSNIIGIERTHSIQELVKLYSAADVVLNLSYEETFGLTTVEGLACGTPGIVYDCTASPELVTPETGVVVEPGDVDAVAAASRVVLNNGKSYYSKACRNRAVKQFDKNERFADYLQLYESLI